MNLILFLLALGAICAPGVLLWGYGNPDHDWLEAVTWGATLGLALSVLLAFYVAYARLSWFWPAWVVVVMVSLIWARGANLRQRAGVGLPLLLVLGLLAVTRFLPAVLHDVPPGWDPSFHLILAKKLFRLDHTFQDWRPFADVRLNYPLGSHLLIAVIGRVTNVPLHRIFQFLIPTLGVLSTAQIFCLARRLFESESVALYSAVAYGFWAYLGSIGYYEWGGLPNELGMVFLVAALAMFVRRAWSGATWFATATFLAGVMLSHHHVMLVAGLLVAVVLWFRRRLALDVKRPITAAAFALVLASPWVIALVYRAATLGETDVFRFDEPHTMAGLAGDLGIPLIALAAVGVCLAIRKAHAEAVFLLANVIVLLAAFVACGPVYRFYSLHRWGQAFSAFTPSRFVTDSAYFLSIFAGYGFCQLAGRVKTRPVMSMFLALLLGCLNIPLWLGVYRADPEEDARWRAYQWIEKNTEPDAIVLARDPWASYVTWRRTPYPQLPVSEPRPNSSTDSTFSSATPRYEVLAPRGAAAAGTIAWTDPSGWSVVRLAP